MENEKKIYKIPDVEIIGSGIDLAGIPFDIVLVSFIISMSLVFLSNGIPLLRIIAIPTGMLAGFAYYHFVSKRDKSFYKQIGYYLTFKRVKGMPMPTDNEFVE